MAVFYRRNAMGVDPGRHNIFSGPGDRRMEGRTSLFGQFRGVVAAWAMAGSIDLPTASLSRTGSSCRLIFRLGLSVYLCSSVWIDRGVLSRSGGRQDFGQPSVGGRAHLRLPSVEQT